jgi:transcriptional regulator with XRE-family HTH domain
MRVSTVILRAIRQSENDRISQAEISRATGIAPPVLSRFVDGQRGLSMAAIDRLAEFFGLALVPTGKGIRWKAVAGKGKGGKPRPGDATAAEPGDDGSDANAESPVSVAKETP